MSKEEGKKKKPIYLRWWFIVIAVVVVISAVSGGADDDVADGDTDNNNSANAAENNDEENEENEVNGNANNADNNNNNEGNANNEENETNNEDVNNEGNGNNEDVAVDEDGDEAPVSGLGNVVQVGDVEYTIHSVDTTQEVGDEFMSESTNDIFVIVSVTAENVGTDSVTLNSSDLKLILDENTYDADSMASMYSNDDDMGLFLESINPGSSIDANVAFDVNPDVAEDNDLMVQVQQGLLFAETALVRLND